jgi:uncharacterized protein DUF4232
MTSFPPAAGRTAAAAVLTLVAALATACGGSSGSAAPTQTLTVPATSAGPAAPATQPSTSPATPATAPPQGAGPPPCPTRYLQAKTGLSQGTAGSTYLVLDFVNISNITCTLYGYPGVSFGGGTPVTQIGLAAAESTATPRQLVTLAPRGIANALLQIVHAANISPAQCNPVTATWLQIYPPGQTTPIYLSYSSQTCAKPVHILTVSVVQPGSGGG